MFQSASTYYISSIKSLGVYFLYFQTRLVIKTRHLIQGMSSVQVAPIRKIDPFLISTRFAHTMKGYSRVHTDMSFMMANQSSNQESYQNENL